MLFLFVITFYCKSALVVLFSFFYNFLRIL